MTREEHKYSEPRPLVVAWVTCFVLGILFCMVWRNSSALAGPAGFVGICGLVALITTGLWRRGWAEWRREREYWPKITHWKRYRQNHLVRCAVELVAFLEMFTASLYCGRRIPSIYPMLSRDATLTQIRRRARRIDGSIVILVFATMLLFLGAHSGYAKNQWFFAFLVAVVTLRVLGIMVVGVGISLLHNLTRPVGMPLATAIPERTVLLTIWNYVELVFLFATLYAAIGIPETWSWQENLRNTLAIQLTMGGQYGCFPPLLVVANTTCGLLVSLVIIARLLAGLPNMTGFETEEGTIVAIQHDQTYHLVDCEIAIADYSEWLILDGIQEAEKEGYRPCPECKPDRKADAMGARSAE